MKVSPIAAVAILAMSSSGMAEDPAKQTLSFLNETPAAVVGVQFQSVDEPTAEVLKLRDINVKPGERYNTFVMGLPYCKYDVAFMFSDGSLSPPLPNVDLCAERRTLKIQYEGPETPKMTG